MITCMLKADWIVARIFDDSYTYNKPTSGFQSKNDVIRRYLVPQIENHA
jgi:hypothetical protein